MGDTRHAGAGDSSTSMRPVPGANSAGGSMSSKPVAPAGAPQPGTAKPATVARPAAGAPPRPQPSPQPPMILVDDDDFARRTSLTHLAVSCAVSMVVHMVTLIALGLMVSKGDPVLVVHEIVATVEDRQEEQLNQVLEQEITPSKTLDLVSATGAVTQIASMQNQTISTPTKAIDTANVLPSELKADVGELQVFTSNVQRISAGIPQGTLGDAANEVKSYADAMDRITAEILAKLDKGKVLVVWLFDQSGSMEDDRKEISSRVERVYAELGVAKSAKGDSVVTSIASYGKETKLHTSKPTSDVQTIIDAIAKVPDDPSGEEKMCPAIMNAVTHHTKYANQGGRQLMCIVVTDESGDPDSNAAMVESTINDCRSLRCPVYFLARESVFGYPYAHMRHIDPETKTHHWLRIDRGPETPYAEQLQVDGFTRRYDSHASGFGPYFQTRIARKTGGIFFMLPSPEVNLVARDQTKYSAESIRNYLPDLSSREDYAAERDKSPFRRQMFQIVCDLAPYDNPYGNGREKEVVVRWAHWPAEKEAFVAMARENYTKGLKLIEYYAAAEKQLAKIAPQRRNEESMRWRANFDLMYAQTVAYQVRLAEYCATVEDIGRNYQLPKEPTHNEWHCYTIAKTKTDAKTKALRERAVQMLKFVSTEHAGTPYDTRARYEIARGFGVELRSHFEDPRRKNVKLPKL